jgi:hypothetical protein
MGARTFSGGPGTLSLSTEAEVFDPFKGKPKEQPRLIYLGACLIAGIRLARESQVHVRVIPTIKAIEESIELAKDIFERVFTKRDS